MGVWGWGQRLAHQLIVRQASQRLRLIQAQKHGILTPGASVCRPRWARKGVTAALLKAAGYSADVAVKTEFAGDLPAHLSCWSTDVGRSDVTVAKVAAPASDPSLRKLSRSIQFQSTSVRTSVSRSLQNKHEQRKAREADISGKQARRKAKKVKQY